MSEGALSSVFAVPWWIVGAVDRGLARIPQGRWGTPEEIAKLVVVLASDVAAYVSGETLIADGGYAIG